MPIKIKIRNAQSDDWEVPKRMKTSCWHVSLHLTYSILSCNYKEEEQDFQKCLWWQKWWLWSWWERIHTKGARAVPRWPPWQPRTPSPCSDVSSSPFSASSPTRQTRLRTDLRSCWHKILNWRDHLTRKLATSYKQSDRQSQNLWKRQMQSNVTIRKICKEEKPQRHHSTKQRQRKRDVSLFHRTLGRALAS